MASNGEGPSPLQSERRDSIQPPHSFAHHTTSAAPRQPFIDTSTPAINAAPVELDSTPVSPVAKQRSWSIDRTGRTTEKVSQEGNGNNMGRKNGVSPDHDQEVYGELSGEAGAGIKEREKRAALLKERSQNPAVVVDVPEEPTAEELEVAEVEEEQEGEKTPQNEPKQ